MSLIAVAALAACQSGPAARQDSVPLRNPTAVVASRTGSDVAQLRGDWRIAEAAGVPVGLGVIVRDDRITLGNAVYHAIGDGRYSHDGKQLWLHWVDVGYRTAALGDPAGRMVFVMNRGGALAPDRRSAAHEILDWYGYDLTRLRRATE
ncbi:lipocalin [Pseudoprimorskyibacter insulae]|nr:lipocalin [Pseudoprimorskyibacter insulae]